MGIRTRQVRALVLLGRVQLHHMADESRAQRIAVNGWALATLAELSILWRVKSATLFVFPVQPLLTDIQLQYNCFLLSPYFLLAGALQGSLGISNRWMLRLCALRGLGGGLP